MGLDNGIIMRTKETYTLPSFVRQYKDFYEVLYWRKWWDFRNEVLDCLYENKHTEEFEFNLTLKDLIDIYAIFIKYEDETYYKDHGDTIWDYEEVDFSKYNEQFQWLVAFKYAHPEIELIFYDSY